MFEKNASKSHFDDRVARKARRGPIRKEVALTEYYLSDERWALIASRLPGKESDPGCHGRDNRLFIEAVFWVVRTGSPWRSLPPHFGKWYTSYTRFHRWTQKGVWPGVLNALAADETCEYFYEEGVIRHAPLRRLVAQEAAAVSEKSLLRRKSCLERVGAERSHR